MTKQAEIAEATTNVETCKAELESYRANGEPSWRIKSKEEELEWLEKALEMVHTHSHTDARALAKRSVTKQRKRQLQVIYLWENRERLADIPSDLRWSVVQFHVDRDEERRLAGIVAEILEELREEIANIPKGPLTYSKVRHLEGRATWLEMAIESHNRSADEYDQFARWHVEHGREVAENMMFELRYPHMPRE
jgi:hypothetical protein